MQQMEQLKGSWQMRRATQEREATAFTEYKMLWNH